MRVHGRSPGRALALAGFLLLSLIAHLVVLRGASPGAWIAAPPPAASTVSVALIVPAAPTPQSPMAQAAVAPKPVARPRARPAPRPKRPVPRATPVPAPEVAPPAAASTSAADLDPFGLPVDDAAPGVQARVDPAGAEGDARPVTVQDVRPPAAEAVRPPAVDDVQPATEAAAVPAPAQPAEAPLVVATQAGTVRYLVYYGDPVDGYVVATLEQTFDIAPERYRLHSEGRARGLTSLFYRGALVQDSAGTVSAAGLAPSSYREQRGDRPARTVSIDAERREATFGSGVRREAPPGVQDRMSAVVQLALLRQARPALFERGASIVLPMLGPSRVDQVTWRVLGEEQVATEAGAVAALRLSRESLDGDDPAIDVWLALDSSIVPVRMRITDRGGRALDQVIAAQ